MMKKFLKYFIVMPLLVIIGIILLNQIVFLAVQYFGYVRVKNLEIVQIGESPVKINIPVKFLSSDALFSIRPVRMYTPDRWRYALRCIPEKGEIWVTAHHGGYLINHYTASYEVTDPKVRAELIELFKKAWQEEEKLRKRARAESSD